MHLYFNCDPHWTPPAPVLIGISKIKQREYSLVMQYAAGGTLGRLLINTPPQGWRRVWQIAVEITGRLNAIHKVGLVHGDLHPENIVRANESCILNLTELFNKLNRHTL